MSQFAQYHEVIRELVGKWMSIFTLVVCILAALGSCLPQIVASSANIYRINQNLNKRCGSSNARPCVPLLRNIFWRCRLEVAILSFVMMRRDWAIIFGGIMTLLSFVPSFRNMRLFAIYALIGKSCTRQTTALISSWCSSK